jgi:uncharacterized protein (TIGR03066 family)
MSHALRIAVLVLVVGAVGLTAARAADKPEELIVGKWAPAKAKGTVEFTKNGKVVLTGKDDDGKAFEVSGTYKFVGDDALEVVLTVQGESKKDRLTVKVGKDDLSLTDSKKRTETFKRAR